jgi:hypothetical protein
MLAKIPALVAYLDLAPEVEVMSSKSVAGNTCVWCDVITTLEEKITGLKSVACKTCVLCVAATMAALTLLAVTWTVILVSN